MRGGEAGVEGWGEPTPRRRMAAGKQWCVSAWLNRESSMRPDRGSSRECRRFASSPDQKRRETGERMPEPLSCTRPAHSSMADTC